MLTLSANTIGQSILLCIRNPYPVSVNRPPEHSMLSVGLHCVSVRCAMQFAARSILYVDYNQGSTVRPFHSHLRANISACEREKQNRSTRASDFSTAHYTVRSHQTRRGETIPYKAAIPFAARDFCPARASAFTWISGGLKYLNFAATFA